MAEPGYPIGAPRKIFSSLNRRGGSPFWVTHQPILGVFSLFSRGGFHFSPTHLAKNYFFFPTGSSVARGELSIYADDCSMTFAPSRKLCAADRSLAVAGPSCLGTLRSSSLGSFFYDFLAFLTIFLTAFYHFLIFLTFSYLGEPINAMFILRESIFDFGFL